MTQQTVSIYGILKTSSQKSILEGIVKAQGHIEVFFENRPIFNEPIARLKKEIDSLQEIASKLPQPSDKKYNLSTEEGLSSFVKHNPRIAKKMLWRILYEMDMFCKSARDGIFNEDYFGILLFDIYCFNNLFDKVGCQEE